MAVTASKLSELCSFNHRLIWICDVSLKLKCLGIKTALLKYGQDRINKLLFLNNGVWGCISVQYNQRENIKKMDACVYPCNKYLLSTDWDCEVYNRTNSVLSIQVKVSQKTVFFSIGSSHSCLYLLHFNLILLKFIWV